jgi:predicted SAM-dependent methyltransferase
MPAPDVIADAAHLPYTDDAIADYVVLNHVYEHFGLGEANDLLLEASRILKDGGSLIVTVPDLRELAAGFIRGRLDDITYAIALYGAYMGSEEDRHKFGYTRMSLRAAISSAGSWESVEDFDWRDIPGTSIPRDWWIAGVEAVK